MKKFVVIVAGGSGQRMGNSIPKQFLKIGNEIILMRSIKAFYNYDKNTGIVLALPKNQIEYWKNLCDEYNFDINHKIVEGGETRFHSVKNALMEIPQDGIVAVHDGVRPLVHINTIENTYKVAQEKGNAIPYIDSIDSVRIIENDDNKPFDRDKIKLIQTPQAFSCQIIHRAYKQDWNTLFTDDASVVENLGIQINLVSGNRENIKITTKTDLTIAEAFLNQVSE